MKVLVSGGGAGGLIAAWRAASQGHDVTLLEANARLGAKIRISGGGRCNVTHEGPPRALLAAFPPEQARFLRQAVHAFPGEALRALLAAEGLPTRAREDGRVFPEGGPGTAGRVVEALEALARRAGARIRLGARVCAIEGARPRVEALVLEDGARLKADVYVLATGGASYSGTGTRGEMLARLEALGVPVRPWFPALAPIPLREPRPGWEGVALRGGTLLLRPGPEGRILARFQGDLVFTRAGVSGPAALELSGPAEEARRQGAAWLAYDLCGIAEEALDARIQADQRAHPHLGARAWLEAWLPARLAGPALEILGLPADQRLKDLSRQGRRHLGALLRAFPLGAPGRVDLERGEVCAGGVRLPAVDPGTMAVKGWENLRVCGELLDVDGPVGGYNLQAAFSTGFLAGDGIRTPPPGKG